MNGDVGPRCPGCGYPIFGLRDMRCPECGRALDVRDFNPGAGDSDQRSRKLRRDGQIGVTVGLLALMIPTAAMLLLAGVFIYYGYFPPCLIVLMVVVMVVWFARVLGWAGREAVSSVKKKR